MSTVEDYTSGKVLFYTELTLITLKFVKVPFVGDLIRRELSKRIEVFDPMLVDKEEAEELVRKSSECAIGERVCKEIHKNSKPTKSVFLDELAEGMVEAGKADFKNEEEAIELLNAYHGALIASKVSGKYMEICCTCPEICVYWNMEREGFNCIER